MIGGEGPVAFKDNRSGSPRNKPATPGGTNGQSSIYAVAEKHSYLLSWSEEDSKQLATDSWQLGTSLHLKRLINVTSNIFNTIWPIKHLAVFRSRKAITLQQWLRAVSCSLVNGLGPLTEASLKVCHERYQSFHCLKAYGIVKGGTATANRAMSFETRKTMFQGSVYECLLKSILR